MRDVNLDELESVSGGLALGGLSIANQQQQMTIPGVSFLPNGGFGADQFFPGAGGFHEGRMAFREFVHDPTFAAALNQYAAQHPDQAQALSPLAEAAQGGSFRHAMREVMHDPAGRAALDQMLDDPTFLGAVQQYSATHPDGGLLQNHIARLDARLESGGPFGGQLGSPFGGQLGAPFGGPGDPFGSPFGQPFGQPFAQPFAQPFGQPFAQPFTGVQGLPNQFGGLSVSGPLGASPNGALTPVGSPLGALPFGTI